MDDADVTADAAPFPVVGIGASAGGVEALEAFFGGLPPHTGCAFVVVTHLGPNRPSLLHEIVARHTGMPVHVAEDGAKIRPDHVYVLSAAAIIGMSDRRLTIRPLSGPRRERRPIDLFFTSLAQDQGEYAAAAVLSGGDGDGTLGIKAIKERGGLTLAQAADGHPPQHPEMPDSAIASGLVDLALPVGEMGERLVGFARSFGLLDTLAGAGGPQEGEAAGAREARAEICAILRNQIGHDFSGYKEKTFLRRVGRRMQVHRIASLPAYVEHLRQQPKEVAALFRDLLINVTNFFRDADAFRTLEEKVIPRLFAGRGAEDSVRVWVPGCATGEEVFSIAILLREHMDRLTAVPRVQIFATDIDEAALGVARAGRYPALLLDSVPEERRRRFFIREDGHYQLTKEVRELCVFSPHSVIRDPPFSRLDLVSCRNLLIYFGPHVQDQVIPTFHYALRPGGYLFLGTSENVSQFNDLFTPLDRKHRLFRSRVDVAPPARAPLAVSGFRPASSAPSRRGDRGLTSLPLRQTVESQVLERFAPAHVVVTPDGDVVHYSGRTGKYLEATAGAPTRQVTAMARKGLRLDLRTALREAVEADRRVVREGVSVETDAGLLQPITLTVEPLAETGPEDRLFLVLFTDVGPVLSREDSALRGGVPDEAVAHLERELRDTRERLQSLVEEYETALEELKSSNEELVSVNEELQSTNEELEASKEELQSLNEELQTVNLELSGKVEQLDAANGDLTNLFESTKVATVFLDQHMAIRSFTPAVSQVFAIRPGDRGRPLTDLSSRIHLPRLVEDVREVFVTGKMQERSIDRDDGAHYLLRLVPYRDAEGVIVGVVLTFVDVTSLTEAEAQQRVLIAELNHRVKNMLAVVINITDQTMRSSSDPAVFRPRLIERFRAMARSYELLSRENWRQTLIADLIGPEIAPFGSDRATVEGPPLRLKPRHALSFGMIVHELATNAGKYGAFSVPGGRLAVNWTRIEHPGGATIVLVWEEVGGPPVSPREHEGLGLRLVERQTSYSLDGEAEIAFRAEGVRVTLRFPDEDRQEEVPA